MAKDATIEAGNIILTYYKADYEIRDKVYHNCPAPMIGPDVKLGFIDLFRPHIL